jgi:acetolactate synthase small subunit
MTRIARFRIATAIAAALVAAVGLLSVLLSDGVEARDLEVGTILLCDTEQQAERVTTLLRDDEQNIEDAIDVINAKENGLPVCDMAEAEYVRGADVASVRLGRQTYQIAPILLIGILRGNSVQPVPQNVYYSAFQIDERAA